MSKQLLTVSTSPHLMGKMSVRSMHVEFMIALLPAIATGIYYFGGPALTTILLAVCSAVVTEAVLAKLTKQPVKVGDLHAVLMGLLLGLILPPVAFGVEDACPWWIPVVGSVIAIGLGKTVFGGLGNYPMNPVLIAWAALALSWPEHTMAILDPMPFGTEDPEWVVSTTPLMELKDDIGAIMSYEMADLWKGMYPSAVGVGGTWALLVGGIYLVFRRIISWQIPLGVILGAIGLALLATYTDERIVEMEFETFAEHWAVAEFMLASGGLMIAAFFLAPEPVSSPVTPWGMFLYGIGIGAMAVIVRFWGAPVDGVFYGVLIMSAATPLFDRIRPKVLGKVVHSA